MRNIIKKDFLKQMKISKIREVKTPTRGTECSAGLDFYVPKGFTARLTSGTDILVPSGIRVEVPHGYALIAMNRSSVATSTDAMRRVGLTPKANTPKGTLVVGACVLHAQRPTADRAVKHHHLCGAGEKMVRLGDCQGIRRRLRLRFRPQPSGRTFRISKSIKK